MHQRYFVIENPTALVSQPPQIRLVNLEPASRIELHAEATDRQGEVWRSSAAFRVPERGRLELSTHASEAGSYRRADAGGLIWSLRPRDDLEPAFFQTPDDGFVVTLRLEANGTLLETATLHRRARHPDLRRIELRENGLVGTLFAPAHGAHSGVLELGGSEGKLFETRAALLASHGFAVLALAYFDLPGLPDQLINVPLEYFARALRWLRARPEVAGERIGVLGSSKGGEAALLIGATYPHEVGGLVAVVPSGLVFSGIDRTGHVPGERMSSWSLGGEPLPFVPYTVDWNTYFSQPPPVSLTPAHREAMERCDPARLEAARIPVERIETPVLLVSGGDDATWPSCDLSLDVQHRLEALGKPVVHVTDPDAGHYLSLPGFPSFVRSAWGTGGGNPEANARVQQEGWERTLETLRF